MTINETHDETHEARQLADDELTAVAGGIIGAIPGYTASIPSWLFTKGYTCSWNSNTGAGTCSNWFW